MSWYETTAFESISLCRSLLDKKTLNEFDLILKANGLEKLCRVDVMKSTQINPSEALAELEWLRTLLVNVDERANKLGIPFSKRKLDVVPQEAAIPSKPSSPASSPRNSANTQTPSPQFTSWRDRIKQRKSSQKPETSTSTSSSSSLRKKSQQRPAAQIQKPQPPKPIEVWCICRGGSAGLMVACDNEECPYEWFHAKCVGLQHEPTDTWYCPLCRPKFDRIRRANKRKR